MKYLCRIDDIVPGENLCNLYELCTFFDPKIVVLGVVPECMDAELPAWSGSVWLGAEIEALRKLATLRNVIIVQHGTYHRPIKCLENISDRSQLNELNGLEFEQKISQIKRGSEFFRENQIPIVGYMPPFHGYTEHDLRAFRAAGVGIIWDGEAVFPFEYGGLRFVPNLTEKPSLKFIPFGVNTTSFHLNKTSISEIASYKDIFISSLPISYRKVETYPSKLGKLTNALRRFRR